jgi:hypothetical protein
VTTFRCSGDEVEIAAQRVDLLGARMAFDYVLMVWV